MAANVAQMTFESLATLFGPALAGMALAVSRPRGPGRRGGVLVGGALP